MNTGNLTRNARRWIVGLAIAACLAVPAFAAPLFTADDLATTGMENQVAGFVVPIIAPTG